MKVVHIGECRELLKGMEAMRARILRGEVKGFAATVLGWDGREKAYFAGQYREDKEAACKAALRMSWELDRQANGGDFADTDLPEDKK